MKIFIDVDNTIFDTPTQDYSKISVYDKVVERINKLYDDGHTIVLWTARGTVTKIDWSELTTQQLKEAGVKYHELRFGKPDFDVFIDDKAFNAADWRQGKYPEL